jgi:hypothetical protein
VSRKGEEYTSGPHKEWDVDAENPDLELSLVALDILMMQVEVEFKLPLLLIEASSYVEHACYFL